MYIAASIVALIVSLVAAVKITKWYADRCVQNSKRIIESKLREYETIAAQ